MKILQTKKYSILSNILRYSFVFILFALLIAPRFFVMAVPPDGPDASVGTDTTYNQINNPLDPDGTGKLDTIPKFIEQVIQIVLIVGIPIIALAIIYVGFLFVAARGNPEKLTTARKALLYTLIGSALLLGAFVIANAIQGTVDEIKKSA